MGWIAVCARQEGFDRMRSGWLLALWGLVGLLSACKPAGPQGVDDSKVPTLAQSGELVVLIRNGANSFHVDSEGNYAGLEYDLVRRFADELGVRVRFVVSPRVSEMATRLARGEAHLAVGVVQKAATGIVFGPPYRNVQAVLVHHARQPKPAGLKELSGSLVMVASVFGPLFSEAVSQQTQAPWRVAEFQDDEELIEHVSSGLLEHVVVENRSLAATQNYYPDVSLAFPLGKPLSLAWAWPSHTPADLTAKINTFFKRIKKDGSLARLLDRYFGHLERLQTMDVTEFLARRLEVLPRYRRFFHEAEESAGLDWRLLAALAYQESHWDPLATSPYGVRGMMMLTSNTADMLGVRNRLDPRQSILGGARYLNMMKDLLPPRIPEPDRTWLALAAYNIGVAHLTDARTLAGRLGKNPDSWADLKSVIPLLRNYEYFSTLKHGYARGGETVIFVENLRSYYDILLRFEPPLRPMFPSYLERVTVNNPHNVRLGLDAASRPAP